MKTFPGPYRFGTGATRWRLSEILAFEAARTGQKSEPLPPEQERYLRDQDVAQRLGISRNSVWRWTRESEAAR